MSARLKLPAPSTVPVALPVAQSTKIKHGSRMVSNLVSIYSPKSWVHRHRGANRIVLILVHESHFGPRIKALSFQRSRATCVKRHRSSIANTRRWFNCALDRSRSVRWLSGWTLGAGSHRIGASQKFPRWRLAGDWSCRFHSARRRQGTWRRAFDPDSRASPVCRILSRSPGIFHGPPGQLRVRSVSFRLSNALAWDSWHSTTGLSSGEFRGSPRPRPQLDQGPRHFPAKPEILCLCAGNWGRFRVEGLRVISASTIVTVLSVLLLWLGVLCRIDCR